MFLKKFMLSSAAAALAVSSVFAANVPVGYSVYSYEDLKIGDRAGMNGGVIGCKSNVLVGSEAVISTDIIAKGNVVLNDRANVDGAVTAGGAVTRGSGVVIKNGFAQYASVPVYTIPTKTFSTGTAIKTVNFDATGSAAPGNYNVIEVYDRGTLNLSSGTYNCNSFKIGHDVKVNFPTGPVIINVKNEFYFRDRAKMILPAGNNGSNIEVYYNGISAITIGFDSYTYGVFTAPNAAVTVADRAKFNGSLFAKKVELQPGLYATNLVDKWLTIDSDGDGVPDYVEAKAGTNGTDATEKPAVVVEGTYANKTATGPQTVALSVLNEIGYSRNKVKMTFAQGSIGGDLIPIVDIITKPTTVPNIPVENGNIRMDGMFGQSKIFSIKGTINSGSKVYMGFPLSDAALLLPQEFLRIYHYNGTAWESIPVDAVVNGVAYAYVVSYSYYAVGIFTNILRVNPNFSTPLPADDFQSLEAAIAAVPSSSTNKYVILVLGDNSNTIKYALNAELPKRTSVIGGFATMPDQIKTTATGNNGSNTLTVPTGIGSKFIIGDLVEISNGTKSEVLQITTKTGDVLGVNRPLSADYTTSPFRRKLPTETEIVNDPQKYPTILIQAVSDQPILKITASASTEELIETYIDGLTLKDATFAFPYTYNAAMFLYSGKHWTDLYVRNCSFLNNSGPTCGAVYLFNVSKVHFQNCVFANNSTSGAICGAAVFANQAYDCGVGASFESCVFYKNSASGSDAAPIMNSGDNETRNAERYLEFRNCTMYGNTGASVISAPYSTTPTTKKMPISNCVFAGNTITGTDIVSPSSQFFKTPEQTTDLGNLTTDPGFVNVSTDAAIIGNDGILGTHDDGLQLTRTSSARNSSVTTGSIPIPTFDVTGRRRLSNTSNSIQGVDKGAYERYINILNVGDLNTFGVGSVANYQVYLKKQLEDLGYMVDFVGPTVCPAGYTLPAVLATELGRDPANKITEGALDLQTGALENGTIDNLLSLDSYAKDNYKNTVYDFALLMVGSADARASTTAAQRSAAITKVATFASSLASSPNHPGSKVIVSCIPIDPSLDDITDEVYRPFATLFYSQPSSVFGTASVLANTEDVNSETKASFISGSNTINNAAGYEFVAQKWLTKILSNL